MLINTPSKNWPFRRFKISESENNSGLIPIILNPAFLQTFSNKFMLNDGVYEEKTAVSISVACLPIKSVVIEPSSLEYTSFEIIISIGTSTFPVAFIKEVAAFSSEDIWTVLYI